MATPVPSLCVSSGPSGAWTVVSVTGVLDFLTCPDLTARLDEVISSPRQRPQVAVDLSGVEFCDSSGLRCLSTASRRVHHRDGAFLLLRVPEQIRWRVEMTGLPQILPVTEELPG